MVIRNLYLSIYLTVVTLLLVFALVAGLLVRRHAEAEHGRIELAVSERTAAFAELLEHSLPEASAPEDEQRLALLDWGRRLRVAVALDSADGQRIASSELFQQLDGDLPDGSLRVVKVQLSDGRALWLIRPGPPRRSGLTERGGGDDRPPPPDARQAREDRPGHGDGPWGGRRHHGPRREGLGAWLDAWLGPRWPRWLDEGGVLVGLLAVLFVAIAAGSYPVVRRLTRRLEALQRGVETFGAGQLSHRVASDGRDEVAALAASFNQAAQRIEDLVRSHRSLLANASHELRSPLARLKMAVSMLEGAGPEQRARLKAEIDRDIRELDVLVDEVLLASRLDAQTTTAAEPIDLMALAAEEAALVGARLVVPDQTTVLEGGSSLWQLHGDERLLRRALRNLLENARRYGGDEVELRLQAGADQVAVSVCDRGPGVPEEERERIFEPFYRLPGHAERSGGVGLGLSLVRQIARRHRGSVCCEPRDGGGSCFVLSLPRLS